MDKYKKEELKQMCKKLCLYISGTKEELYKRILKSHTKSSDKNKFKKILTSKSFKKSKQKLRKKIALSKSFKKSSKKSKQRSKTNNKIVISSKGELGIFGYKDIQYLSTKKRHSALKKYIIYHNSYNKTLSLFRKLNALSILNRNKNFNLSTIYEMDKMYIKKNYLTKKSSL